MKTSRQRMHSLRDGDMGEGPVVYWMSREQRVHDNWPLLIAQHRAIEMRRALLVVFCLDLGYPSANLRHFGFMLRGLAGLPTEFRHHNIGFRLLEGYPPKTLAGFLHTIKPATLFTDFDPLRHKKRWISELCETLRIPVVEVDGHNIVPARIASDKREYAAWTFRKKLKKILPQFLTPFPRLEKHPFPWDQPQDTIEVEVLLGRVADQKVPEVEWLPPGEVAARKAADTFLSERLTGYDHQRNDPCLRGQSDLSPYLHFGQLSSQRLALEVQDSDSPKTDRESFLEELIVRKELADNFCLHAPDYDATSCFPNWARQTLSDHLGDPRPFLADLDILDNRKTPDELWNHCQKDLAESGKLHGYLRMYWAKKILEWSEPPEQALETSIHLNDRYSLDGRDPNGYAGIAWSIGGVHDRAWPQRPVFGKVRSMTAAGCARKFDTAAYMRMVG